MPRHPIQRARPRLRLALPLAGALAAVLAAGGARARASAAPAAHDLAASAADTIPHEEHAHAASPGRRDTPSAAARAQLATARRAVAALGTPEAAMAEGFRPMFGHVPLQGEHYVRVDRVLEGAFDIERPSVLLFAPVRGRPTLVGVAYAFLHPAGAAPPRGFDGADDAWHAHERLARVPGRHLVMMHAWLVDAPDGPFARYNPWLPYLAAGLTPPVGADDAAAERGRRLGLALASALTPPLLFEWIEREAGEAVRSRSRSHRDAIGELVPRLAAAERAGDAATRARLADDAIRHGEALVAGYRAAMPGRPLVGRLVGRTVDEFLGRGHGIEEELGALLDPTAEREAERP